MGKDGDYGRYGRVSEQNVEETIAHVGQVIARVRALNLEAAVVDRFTHWCVDLANDLEDESFEEV